MNKFLKPKFLKLLALDILLLGVIAGFGIPALISASNLYLTLGVSLLGLVVAGDVIFGFYKFFKE